MEKFRNPALVLAEYSLHLLTVAFGAYTVISFFAGGPLVIPPFHPVPLVISGGGAVGVEATALALRDIRKGSRRGR